MNTLLGATHLGDGQWRFLVWAPRAKRLDLVFTEEPQRNAEEPQRNAKTAYLCATDARGEPIALDSDERGYYQAVTAATPGARYYFLIDGEKRRPDPASRFQPLGVHGPSEIVDAEFDWQDGEWRGIPLADYVIYELHVGTFTPEGTFLGAIEFLDELKSLGITAVELMPVAQFPGTRNWGYDGVYPFAVQGSYGGPVGLKRFVNACHLRGLAVILDVVYNHLGPEGNYLAEFAPYFTDRYHTPWGAAINFDGPQSDQVRRFFIENALYWITEFHIDALRLDAIHAIFDQSAFPFLEELGVAVHRQAELLNRPAYVIPESDLNDPRMVTSRELGGFGLDAQWNDDFHHSLHTLLTGETSGYYQDFGALHHLGKAFRQGFVYSGQYSRYRQRRFGRSSDRIAASRLVVFAQNHDQIGNRMLGDRLSQGVDFGALKLAAGAVLLSPYIPLLFMGEEYGETAPFQYFVSHSDAALIAATRQGRQEEFAAFGWNQPIPDPQDEATFLRSKLHHELAFEGRHQTLKEYYRELLRLRRQHASLRCLSKENMEVRAWETEKVLLVHRWCGEDQTSVLLTFAHSPTFIELPLPVGKWLKELDSEDRCWGGSGSELPTQFDSAGQVCLTLKPQSLAVFTAG